VAAAQAGHWIGVRAARRPARVRRRRRRAAPLGATLAGRTPALRRARFPVSGRIRCLSRPLVCSRLRSDCSRRGLPPSGGQHAPVRSAADPGLRQHWWPARCRRLPASCRSLLWPWRQLLLRRFRGAERLRPSALARASGLLHAPPWPRPARLAGRAAPLGAQARRAAGAGAGATAAAAAPRCWAGSAAGHCARRPHGAGRTLRLAREPVHE